MIISFLKKISLQRKIDRAEKEAFAQTKEYKFSFSVNVNCQSDGEKIKVWQAIAPDFSYQKILDRKFTNLEPTEILEDREYHNKVAFWEIENSKKGNIYTFSQETTLTVEPRVSLKIFGSIHDYEKKLPYYQLYTKDDPFFSYSNDELKTLADTLKGDSKDVKTIAWNFYEYVRGHLVYGDATEGLYSSTDALTREKVDCGGFDSLIGAMLRYSGIPARLVSGYLIGSKSPSMHAWLEFMTPEGNWVPMDPANDHLRLKARDIKPGGFGKVGNDRIALSVGSNIKVADKIFPLIQVPEVEVSANSETKIEKVVKAEETL